MLVARHYNGDLEKEFIVAHWDQRGAGKSNPLDFDGSTMTLAQFQQDAHGLTLYLKEKFQKKKIYILGHSWGTIIGAMLARSTPEDYHAYIGVSQVVHFRKANHIAYAWLKEQVQGRSDPRETQRLESLGLPPFLDHGTHVRFAKMVDQYGGSMDIGFARTALAAVFAPEYRLSDYIATIRGANRGSGPMWPEYIRFDALADAAEIETHVFLLSGSDDYNTPVALVQQYHDALKTAGLKEMILFEDAAQPPFFSQPEAFHEALRMIKDKTSSP